MVDGNLLMRTLAAFLALAVVGGVLTGCGDPPPSTPLAPEKPLPDTSKMTPEEIAKLHGGGNSGPADRSDPKSGRQ